MSYILIDLEWVENDKGYPYPTQISAVRVDNIWSETESFFEFIVPKNKSYYLWKKKAFIGGTPGDFLKAKDAKTVFVLWSEWLKPDDILVLWNNAAVTSLQKFYKKFVNTTLRKQCIPANPYICKHLQIDLSVSSTPYYLAMSWGVKINSRLHHYAKHETELFQELLKEIDFPHELFFDTTISLDEETPREPIYPTRPYQHDVENGMIHLKQCPKIANVTYTIGHKKLRDTVKKGVKLCECCREAYKAELRQVNADIISRTQFTFVYTPTSNIYHKRNCRLILNAKEILGSRTFKPIEESKRVPCKICKPSPSDELVEHKDGPNKQEDNTPIEDVNYNGFKREERNAMMRQTQALKERDERLSDPTLSDQERKDIITLTQPRFAFWAATGYQNFHLRNCPKLQGLTNIKGFRKFKDAKKAGYIPCKTCKPTAKHDMDLSIPINNKVRANEGISDLEELCQKENYKYHCGSYYFDIETPVGLWQIDISSNPVRLKHKNITRTARGNYHDQPRLFLSLIDAFFYIKQHDGNLMIETSESGS